MSMTEVTSIISAIASVVSVIIGTLIFKRQTSLDKPYIEIKNIGGGKYGFVCIDIIIINNSKAPINIVGERIIGATFAKRTKVSKIPQTEPLVDSGKSFDNIAMCVDSGVPMEYTVNIWYNQIPKFTFVELKKYCPNNGLTGYVINVYIDKIASKSRLFQMINIYLSKIFSRIRSVIMHSIIC